MSRNSSERLEALIDSVLADGAPMSLADLIARLSNPHACGRFLDAGA